MTNICFDNMNISMINNDSVMIDNKFYNIPEHVKNNGNGISITNNNGKLYINGYELTPDGKFIPSDNSSNTNSISINSSQNIFDDLDDEFLDELDIMLVLNGIF